MNYLIFLGCLIFTSPFQSCKPLSTQSSDNTTENSDSTRVIISNRDSINLAIARSNGLEIMRDAGVPGTVIIEIFVNSQGQYIRSQVMKSPHPIATQAILDFVPLMRFEIDQGQDYQQDSEFCVEFRFKYTTP